LKSRLITTARNEEKTVPSEGRYIQMNTSHSQRLCGQVAVEQRVRTGNDESEVGGFSHFLNRIQFFQL